VTLARTLLKNPKLLILDDATSSVDTETEASIREALNRLMDNRTSFIIAHRIQTVMYADLILVMDGGRIVQMGTHAELLEEDGVYKQTYEMQSRIETEIERELSNV
jgi:ATP-binding cassette subfamily B protein